MAKYRRIPKEIEAIKFTPSQYWDYVDNKTLQNGEEKFLEHIVFHGHTDSRQGNFKLDPKEKNNLLYSPTTIEKGDYIILLDDNSIFVVDERAFKDVYEELQ